VEYNEELLLVRAHVPQALLVVQLVAVGVPELLYL
jgi:hypothetical protein